MLGPLRRTGLPLRPIAPALPGAGSAQAASHSTSADSARTAPAPGPNSGPASRTDPVAALRLLAARLGQPPRLPHTCAPAGDSDVCLGLSAPLPPPLSEALLAERRDPQTGAVTALTAEFSFPAATGGAPARLAELTALLRRTFGPERSAAPLLFAAPGLRVTLELLPDLGGQSYVYLDLRAAPTAGRAPGQTRVQ